MSAFRKQQGFTLMELMIVVGIMAILAMAAIPAYQGYLATTRGNTHFQNYEEARRFVAAECAKAAAGGGAVDVITTLNSNGDKLAPGTTANPPDKAFVAGTGSAIKPGQVGISGLDANNKVQAGVSDVTVSLGDSPANGVPVDQYPGHGGSGATATMPPASTIICASN